MTCSPRVLRWSWRSRRANGRPPGGISPPSWRCSLPSRRRRCALGRHRARGRTDNASSAIWRIEWGPRGLPERPVPPVVERQHSGCPRQRCNLPGPAPSRVSKARDEQHWLAVSVVKDKQVYAIRCSRPGAAVLCHVHILVQTVGPSLCRRLPRTYVSSRMTVHSGRHCEAAYSSTVDAPTAFFAAPREGDEETVRARHAGGSARRPLTASSMYHLTQFAGLWTTCAW
jgi:hypothetical protein